MSNTHSEKYITKLLIGLAFVTAGIFVIMFSVSDRLSKDDWYFWAIIAAVSFNFGLILVCNAFVHKIKSDLIRRGKQREQQKTFTSD